MPSIDYAAFDADNHYYEARDSFTRHLDPKLAARAVQWAEIDGRQRHLVGGRVSRAVTNPTFDPIAKPGALYDFVRGRGSGESAQQTLRVMGIRLGRPPRRKKSRTAQGSTKSAGAASFAFSCDSFSFSIDTSSLIWKFSGYLDIQMGRKMETTSEEIVDAHSLLRSSLYISMM